MIVVADSSPIISLAIIEQLDVLTALFDEVYIPRAVWEELIEVKTTETTPKIQAFFSKRVKTLHSANTLFPFVDYGESEAILLCQELQADYLIADDKKAREIAEALGVACIGTIGVLYRAKEKGLLEALRPLFLKLLTHKRYYTKAVLNQVLCKAQELPIRVNEN